MKRLRQRIIDALTSDPNYERGGHSPRPFDPDDTRTLADKLAAMRLPRGPAPGAPTHTEQ